MTELSVLICFLSVAFILAPLMTNIFFLSGSKAYSKSHAISLLVLFFGLAFDLKWATGIWGLFCIFGLLLYVRQEGRRLFSLKGLAACIPFVFSLVSAAWLIAGSNELYLLGYNTNWSFYAALHGSILGWIFIGCIAFLARAPNASKSYLFSCFLCLFLFLSVAFGIDGVPYIKRLGVVGLSILVPFSIGVFLVKLERQHRLSRIFAAVSFLSILLSMTIAMLNEFLPGFPKIVFGMPLMTLTHGFLNTLVTIPFLYVAILLEKEDELGHRPAAVENVIFFDGFCVLCSGTVTQLLRIDKNRAFRYSSLQGDYAKRVLDSPYIKSGESVVFLCGNRLYEKGDAVIQILMTLGGGYKLLGMFLNVFPLAVLNLFYDFIARNRYHLFGKRVSCLIPSDETSNLFIS